MTKPPRRPRAWNSSLPAPSHGLPRSSSSLSRGPMQRKGRKPSETERAHGSEARRIWTKAQPCVICGRVPSDAGHVKNGGCSRKADAAFTVPLCSDAPGYLGHHAEYDGRKHAGGKRTFERKYGVSMIDLAAETDRRWAEHLTRTESAA